MRKVGKLLDDKHLSFLDRMGAKMVHEYAQYLSGRRLSENTIRLPTTYIRRFVTFQHERRGPFVLRDLEESDLELFLNSNPKWKPATRQSVRASLCSFFKWAERQHYIDASPADDLPPIRVPKSNAKIVDDAVSRDALRRATLEERAMLLLRAECGLRVAEIAALAISDRNGMWLTVTGKGNQVRSVDLSPELAHILDRIEQRRMRPFYFPSSTSGHVANSTIWRHVRALINMNTHALRHRAGTVVYRGSGHDLRLAQTFLGHASPSTTAIYVHIADDDLQRAATMSRVAA